MPNKVTKFFRLLAVFPAGIVFFLTAGALHAQLIDVDFNNDSAGSAHGGPPLGPTMSGAAVLGSTGDQWNGINTANGSGISLIYANGNASTVTLTFTSGGGYDAKSYSGSTPFAATSYDALMEDYLFNGSVAQTITLSGLATNSAYNLVLYNAADNSAGANGRTTSFTVNGNTQNSTWNATSSTLIAGVDYVQFTSALSDGSGSLVITYNSPGIEGDINGFQLQGPPGPPPTPTVTITNPASGAVFAAPANVNIAANATVSGGTVTNVQFFTNSVFFKSVLTAPFSITASNLTAGTYALTAVATAAGISATSAVVNVSVMTIRVDNSAAYTWTTFAGHPPSGSADGVGGAAEFNDPAGVAVDGATNVYVTDYGNSVVRKITPSGLVSTIVGTAGNFGNADGTNNAAQFGSLWGITADGGGNLYVSDRYYGTIRKITPVGTNWVVTTIAGSAGIEGTADGTGTNARFNQPFGLAVDVATNIYVADAGNGTIRKIMPSGTNWLVTTIAGLGEHYGSADGTGTNAQFFSPSGIVSVSATNLYVTDTGEYTVRKMTLTGTNWVVTTIAGSAGNYGTNDGVGGVAQFNSPAGIAADNSGNLYVADYENSTIRKMVPSGNNWMVSTFAGTIRSYGNADLTGTSASFHNPNGLAMAPGENLYVTDFGNNEIRKVATVGAAVSTIAGSDGPGSANGSGSAARFNTPEGVTVDGSGNVYVADTVNDTIRLITSLGQVSTIAGSPGNAGSVDQPGSNARFNFPQDIAVDSAGNLYVTDSQTNRIREIMPGGLVSTIAVLGGQPWGITIDGANNLYVTENYRNTIVKIAPVAGTTNWVVSLVAGLAGVSGSQDGTNSAARFNTPDSIAVDSATNLYVADSNNHTIRKISPVGTNWVVTTIAGLAGNSGSADGLGTSARFFQPSGIAVDRSTNLYVTSNASLIRKITPLGSAWVVSTIGGNGSTGSMDGTGSAAQFSSPQSLTVDALGNVYVADSFNNTIRKGVFSAFGAVNLVSYTPPVMTGKLTVTLMPSNANGQWRFPWEIGWRNSGTTASNLAQDNYTIQFRALPGWLAVPSSLQNVAVQNGATTFVTNQYYPTISNVGTNIGGTLTITIDPGSSPPPGAGWRFLGDTTPFYPSGSTNLVAGTYLIEFAFVTGYSKPPNLSVQVQAGLTTLLTENYLIPQSLTNGFYLPFPVPVNNISNLNNYPFGFNGQLQSDVGYGSGVAVQTNVVLTAAHLVFNDQTLSYVSQAYWYFQQEAGVFAPEPQAARGWYVLSGYAAQRTSDLLTNGYAPDQSSAQSRNFDVAALYFLLPVAGGGYGGYLPSDASPNPWLTGTSLKMLVGYPVDGSEFGIGVTNGDMYQTQPQPYPLTISSDSVTNQQEVYIDPNFLGYPGNSGGPVYVQFNGYYYPAGVYLGTLYNGVTPYASVVRAIDSAVVNLITNAAILGDSYTNHTGGGVITVVPNQAVSASNPGYLEFVLGPPAAVAAGAGWQLQGDTAYSSATNYVRVITTTNPVVVVFKAIAGWDLPPNQALTIQPGQFTIITNALYTMPLQIVSPQVSGGSFNLSFQSVNGQGYTLYYNDNLATTNWLPYTNVTGNGGTLQLSVPVTNSTRRFFRFSTP